MEMEDQYGMPDLRHLMNGSSRSHFPTIPQHPVDLFSSHRNLTPPDHHHHHHYEMLMVAGRQAAATVGHDHLGALPRGLHEYHHDTTTTATSAGGAGAGGGGAAGGSTATITVTATSSGTLSGLETEGGCIGGGDGGTGRWPRQETLTLLEIRSRLDHKFKEANQKGPLWDEVSRIMSEEHGYQRSGKKCREKFENLYKYYKKTKEGKAGRQDGKHYRFFRQLEALYGETNNNNNNPVTLVSDQSHIVPFHHSGIISNNISSSSQPNNIQESNFQALHQKLCTDSLSLSNNSSEFDSSSSDDHNDDPNYANAYIEKDENLAEKMSRKRRGRRSWKAKIKEFIDTQMRRLMEKQEAWLEKMMKTIENKERERMMREEEWKKQEAARLEREHKFWANERAWIEARDAALMEALQKLKGKDIKAASTRADELMLMPAELLRNFGENQNENNAGVENNNTSSTNGGGGDGCWPETEITRLIQLRLGMDSRFQQCGCSEEDLWEEIATKMACLGYERTAITCKEKWDNINNYMIRRSNKENGKKRKENSRSGCYYQNSGSDSMYNQGGETYVGDINGQVETEIRLDLDQPNGGGSSPTVASNSNAGNNGGQESCFRFLMGSDGENLWENYGVRLNNKGENP